MHQRSDNPIPGRPLATLALTTPTYERHGLAKSSVNTPIDSGEENGDFKSQIDAILTRFNPGFGTKEPTDGDEQGDRVGGPATLTYNNTP